MRVNFFSSPEHNLEGNLGETLSRAGVYLPRGKDVLSVVRMLPRRQLSLRCTTRRKFRRAIAKIKVSEKRFRHLGFRWVFVSSLSVSSECARFEEPCNMKYTSRKLSSARRELGTGHRELRKHVYPAKFHVDATAWFVCPYHGAGAEL